MGFGTGVYRGSMEINGHSWIVLEESYPSNVCVLSPSSEEVQSKK